MREVIKKETIIFLDASKQSNECLYLVLFGLFVTSHMVLLMGWKSSLNTLAWQVHHVLFASVMWGSAIYLFSVLAAWRTAWYRTGEMILIGLAVFVATGLISKILTSDSYTFIMGLFFCLMGSEKRYKMILHTVLALFVFAIMFGLVGMKIGITVDTVKPFRTFGGHSLGIIYPNHWGSFAFVILVLAWYLFLQNRRVITVILFWSVAVFMFKFITCYTIAGIAFLFPIVSIIAELFQKREDSFTDNKKILRVIIVTLPFIIFCIMLILCWQMDWIHDTFYKTPLRSFAMRFVEGGYSIRRNGISLFGHPFKQWDKDMVSYSTEIELIVDSAFVCYLIIRGLVAMILTLSWISFTHYKCMKNKDYRLIVISMFMLLFSMMERLGLDAWFNFVMLYPLAALSKKRDVLSEMVLYK